MSITCKGLTYTYNKGASFQKTALSDVNLTIDDGEFVAIVGHTGSGKSTFLQHLNALIRVQEGELVVNGYDLSDKKTAQKTSKKRKKRAKNAPNNLKAVRESVGMVFQYPEYQLFADTVLADVSFGPKNFGKTPEECEALARRAIETVGLDYEKVKNKSPFDLSGGEKRRVAFAGVLAMSPKVLVLDEPTAGLDPRGKKEILDLVHRLNRENGVTVIMVSHDMDEVLENADRVIVFQSGKVVYDTTPRELFRHEDDVVAMNLEVPRVAQFLNVLEKAGYPSPDDVVTVDGAVEFVAKIGGGAHA